MKTGTLQLMPRKARLLTAGLIGLLSLLMLLLWWSGTPAVFAQEGGEGKSQDSQSESDGDTGGLDQSALRCILGILGRVPSSLEDLSDDEKQRIGQECLSGGQSGPGEPAVPESQSTQCIVRTLGRIPAGPNDFTEDEKRLVAQTCFGAGGERGLSGVAVSNQGLPDGPGMQCILEVLGRMPSGPDDLNDDEKRRIAQACFSSGRGGPQGQGGKDGPDEAGVQCILKVLGRMPSGPDDFTDEEKRRVGQACFSDGRDAPRGDDPGPQGQGGPDDATMQCMTDALGRMPSGPDDFTEEEKRLVGRECFGGGGREGGGGGGRGGAERRRAPVHH